ncbi:methyltransferase-like protein 25B [Episyrphus balteatus]|uniref:methyltransferase-like protein 25B n=1 Tax=Episyrphus balteatus TaxID=286459 RepID=UPI002485FDE4|nr:methyltransferase-like protein 25B [Episyrphus balteatus]
MSEISPQQLNSKCLKENLTISLQIIQKYRWLIDTYVLDFYVENHWSKLPKSWQNHLEPLDPHELANILSGNNEATSVRPLSILCLMSLMKKLCISRDVVECNTNLGQTTAKQFILEHPKLKNLFTKCVKPKKRHEIALMANVCSQSVVDNCVDFVVDFGAGLGHLARVLGYAYGVQVCCLEMQDSLNDQARVIDSQFEVIASKFLSLEQRQHFRRPVHVAMKLTSSLSPEEFVNQIANALGMSENCPFSFGIIGLHPCGDLGAILIQMFLNCKQAKFLNFVGCCYMKLSTGTTNPGYPLSDFLKNEIKTSSILSYESREIACHAAEVYCDRLSNELYEDLKVHSFRATIEKIFVKYWPELKHSGLRSVKHSKGMSFDDYVKRATNGLNINVPVEDIHSETTQNDLSQWKRIVIFYTMRLLFAPLVETVVLYDRILYLKEKGLSVSIAAIFDPRLSPRNHITRATKQ